MTDKIAGWPEPVEIGGHMVKRSNGDLNDRQAVFTCVDCGVSQTGGVQVFWSGFDGCADRPESLNGISLNRNEGEPEPTALEARENWRYFARRVGQLPHVEDFAPVDNSDTVCATFTFKGQPYELRYNQRGSHGAHHIHAVKIEEGSA
jgi:hypothetical protein